MSTAADPASEAEVGHVPSGPHRLSARDWFAALKRTAKQFLADNCTGLSQQVAFGALLAFFPSVILLVGLLGLIGAYEELKTFLATWLALLIVTLFLFVLVAVLGLLGVRSIKKGTPPVPQQAIQEAKLTTTAIRSE